MYFRLVLFLLQLRFGCGCFFHCGTYLLYLPHFKTELSACNCAFPFPAVTSAGAEAPLGYPRKHADSRAIHLPCSGCRGAGESTEREGEGSAPRTAPLRADPPRNRPRRTASRSLASPLTSGGGSQCACAVGVSLAASAPDRRMVSGAAAPRSIRRHPSRGRRAGLRGAAGGSAEPTAGGVRSGPACGPGRGLVWALPPAGLVPVRG